MTTPSVRPPAPDGELIATWQEGWMRLLSVGPGRAAVVITHDGGPLHVADVPYSDGPPEVEWTPEGQLALATHKRTVWRGLILSAVDEWRAGR